MSLILSNAGPLIALGKLNHLDLLATLYTSISIPQAVYTEVVTVGSRHGHADARLVRRFWEQQKWPIVTVPQDLLTTYQPSVLLDAGETELLALARQVTPDLILIDDEVARREARRLGFVTRGTLGILVQAYRQNIISRQKAELLIDEISARPDIWISAELCRRVLAAF